MKLTNKIGLIAAAIVIVAAIVGLYTAVYLPQAAEQDDLTARLQTAQARLPGLTAQKNDLQDELASAESSLDAIQAQYPQEIHSIEYGEYVFDIVEDSNLRLSTLSFPRPAGKKEGSVTYRVVSLTLPVTGALENIFDFINTINTDLRFASTRVKSVVISGGSATINVDIYSYNG